MTEAKTISHYRILEKLGSGGMGEVYLAEDMKLGRKVAVKLLSEEFTSNRDRVNRFEQEACAASSLNHPNILTIYEVGVDEGHHFMATEFIDGETLREKISGSSLEITQVLEFAIQIASALDEAHAAGIIHRDIKPENIMVRRNGYVKLLDFGLAKLTEREMDQSSLSDEASTRMFVQTNTGVVMGTSHYMSPEQTRGRAVDSRTDLWSLGVVIYEMAAGKLPFTGETATDVLVAITQKEPQPLARYTSAAPAELEWITNKALRKDREERYQTAKELLTDLRRLKHRLEFEAELERSVAPEKLSSMTTISDHGSVPTTAATPGATTTEATAQHHVSSAEYIISEIKRRKKGVGLVAALFVLLVGAGVILYFNKAHALTDQDTILIADFTNTTGETVFDGTLRQALAVQLGQTPFLNIFPEERVRQTLRFMGRSADDRITRDVGREICQRQGIKALLVGSISSLGSHYVISLEALNGQTGDSIARDQVEADSKEQVLSALSKSASNLREKLGESLSSIKKFDMSIEQATTSSLDALKAYASGNEFRTKGNVEEAAKSYQRAIELDPNFAMAYARLAVQHANNSEIETAKSFAEKAYSLRDRVSDHERFYIEEKYHTYVTGDVDKTIEVLQQWASMYPNDYVPHNNLANNYSQTGQFDAAVKEALEAVRLDPRNTTARGNLIDCFIRVGRIDEARQSFLQLQSQVPEATSTHIYSFLLATMNNDQATAQREIEWSRGKPAEADFLSLMAAKAISQARISEAKNFVLRSIELYKAQNRKENTAQSFADLAAVDSVFGMCDEAKSYANAGLAIARGRITDTTAAFAFARCKDPARGIALMDDLVKEYPKDTVVNSIASPSIKALIELNRNNAAQALQLLEPSRRFDLGSIVGFRNNYLRGLAYLDLKQGTDAAKEFQIIVDHPTTDPFSPLYSLAHLGLARAAVLNGDVAKARTAYQDFLVAWKDGDQNLAVLEQAKKEYDALK